jgi:hypothetical protein
MIIKKKYLCNLFLSAQSAVSCGSIHFPFALIRGPWGFRAICAHPRNQRFLWFHSRLTADDADSAIYGDTDNTDNAWFFGF